MKLQIAAFPWQISHSKSQCFRAFEAAKISRRCPKLNSEIKNRRDFFGVRFRITTFLWVHANGGIINGGVACVGAEWRVFVHFSRFGAFLCVSVRFFLPKWPAKKRKFAHNPAKMCKKRFYAVPPLVIPPFACHRVPAFLKS